MYLFYADIINKLQIIKSASKFTYRSENNFVGPSK